MLRQRSKGRKPHMIVILSRQILSIYVPSNEDSVNSATKMKQNSNVWSKCSHLDLNKAEGNLHTLEQYCI